MSGIEQMRWAKSLLEEKSGGAFELTVGNTHGDLFLRCTDRANVGLYLSVLPNMKTQQYDCTFQSYTRCSCGYLNAVEMQRLADEYQMVASLQKELEATKITLSQDELCAFAAGLTNTEEEIIAPQMGM